MLLVYRNGFKENEIDTLITSVTPILATSRFKSYLEVSLYFIAT